MALIKCKECGKEISDKAKQCVHCGYENDTIKCKECGKEISKNANVCFHCGNPINKNIRHNETNNNELQTKASTAYTFAILGLLLIGPLTIPGLIMANSVLQVNPNHPKAKNAKIISIIGLILWGLIFIITIS